jgi:serine/threonine-protein phosphatase PGAM5
MIRRGKDQADRAYRRYFRGTVGRDTCDVLVCHGNLIRYLVCRALALGKYAWCSLGSAHCGITVIRIMANGEVVLDSYNDSGHLPAKLRTI